jgi:rubrerythrin
MRITGVCGKIWDSVLAKNRFIDGVQRKITDYLSKSDNVLTQIMETRADSNLELKNLTAHGKNIHARKKKFCNLCGAKIDEAHTLCPKCGNSAYVFISKEAE